MLAISLLFLFNQPNAFSAYGDHDGPYGEDDGIHGGNRLYEYDPENPDAGTYPPPDPRIKGWAVSIVDSWRPDGITSGTPDLVLGQPGGTFDAWSMGDGGWITVSFDQVIANRSGYDFAIWENGFISRQAGNQGLLWAELMFVEVSTDGLNFCRFPSINLIPAAPPLGGFGCIDPTYVHNVAGKHPNGNDGRDEGTPFDLDDLAEDPLVIDGTVNLHHIRYVKLIDVIGDGSTFDSQGNPMLDPYPTPFGTGGADLDAVAILNVDHCPDDPDKIDPGDCGCGNPDLDANQNGISDCLEAEPNAGEAPTAEPVQDQVTEPTAETDSLEDVDEADDTASPASNSNAGTAENNDDDSGGCFITIAVNSLNS